MDYSEHNENKHKIFKYTDENGHVHYVDEQGHPVKRRRPPSTESGSSSGRSPAQKHTETSRSASHSTSGRRPAEHSRKVQSSPRPKKNKKKGASHIPRRVRYSYFSGGRFMHRRMD